MAHVPVGPSLAVSATIMYKTPVYCGLPSTEEAIRMTNRCIRTVQETPWTGVFVFLSVTSLSVRRIRKPTGSNIRFRSSGMHASTSLCVTVLYSIFT